MTEDYAAIAFDRFGEPGDVLKRMRLPRPRLQAGQVRLRVEAIGLNFLDVTLCRGAYAVRPPLPATPGVEAAGTVIEAGDGAAHWLGRAVLACPMLPDGALGDEVVVDAALLVARPAAIPVEVAAAIPVVYQTAWFALRRARLAPGERVLVTAGAGGVGLATIQLAVRAGARVTAVAGGAEKAARCLANGAEAVIDARHDDVAGQLAATAGDTGFSVIVDPVSGPLLEPLLAAIAFEGRYVAAGQVGGRADIDPARFMAMNADLIGLSWGSTYPTMSPAAVAEAYDDVLGGVLDGSIRPVVSRVLALDESPAALDDLAAGRTHGKLVVTIPAAGTR